MTPPFALAFPGQAAAASVELVTGLVAWAAVLALGLLAYRTLRR